MSHRGHRPVRAGGGQGPSAAKVVTEEGERFAGT